MIEFKESKFYKLLQDFFINNDKETFIQFLAEFYNRTEGIIDKNDTQDEIIKELREMYIKFNEEGIDENIVREKVNYFVENNEKIQDIISKLITTTNNIKNLSTQLDTNTSKIDNIKNNYVIYLDENIEDFTTYLNNIINTVESGSRIIFPKNKTIKLGKVNNISKAIIIDFNNCTIVSTTSEDMFTLNYSGVLENNKGRIKLINYIFDMPEVIPNTYIKIDGEINAELNGTFSRAKATHSLIWNYNGYGNKIFGQMQDVYCPRCVYLSHNVQNNSLGHSYDFYIDVDISRNYTGLGIEYEGGTGEITGVVEGCELGGIWYNGIGISLSIKIDGLHCEYNKLFDIKIGNDEYDSSGQKNQGNTIIQNCMLAVSENTSIYYGTTQWITLINNFIKNGVKPISTNSKYSNISVIEGNISPSTIATTGNGNNNITGLYRGLNYSSEIKSNKFSLKDYTLECNNNVFRFGTLNKKLQINDTNLLPEGTTQTFGLGGMWNAFGRVYSKEIVLYDSSGVAWQVNISTNGTLTTTKLT